MRRFWLICLFIFSLMIFAVVMMPLGFLLEKSGANQAGFSWQTTQGGIFNGKISGARLDISLNGPDLLALALGISR